MSFIRPDLGSTLAFLLVVAFILISFWAAIYRSARRYDDPVGRDTWIAVIGSLLWVALMSAYSQSSLMQNSPMPGLPVFFLASGIAPLLLALSPVGKRIALGISLGALVGFQAFRLPLELILHSWSNQGSIPNSMTWQGQNFDIASGIVALAAAPFASRSRWIAWATNGIGFVLLINVIRVAVMSTPLPFAWKVEPPLLLAAYLPYAWIGPVCVGGALAGHVILTRALLAR